MIRCRWEMPDNDFIDSGSRCVKEFGHGRVHIVADRARGAVTFWMVNPRKRHVRIVLHADLRDGSIPSDDECMVLYHYMRAVSNV